MLFFVIPMEVEEPHTEKSEIRIPKSKTNSNVQMFQSKAAVVNFVLGWFVLVWNFEIRISNFN